MILEKWNKDVKKKVMKLSGRERERLDAIIAMHIMVCNMNDENAYMSWSAAAVPDGADEWDFLEFAVDDADTNENKSFDEAVALFKDLWIQYAADERGLYIGGKTY